MKTAPFRDGCMLHKVWLLGLKGTTIRELTKCCEKEGANVTWMLRTLRRKKRDTWTWDIQEEGNKFKIYNVKVSDA